MFINGLGTAAPATRYEQRECWEVLQRSPRYQEFSPRSRALLRKVLTGNNGITSRHLVLDDLNDAFALTPDTLHERFKKHAPRLATEAAQAAMADAGVNGRQIDSVIVSTCTGYLCPGLTSYVSEALGLRPEVMSLDLVGQGCGAALPNLRAAEALLSSRRAEHVLCICVEVCSAALFFDEDPGVLISACLFGDGAGAAVVSRESRSDRSIEWRTSRSFMKPSARELLRFEQKGGMLRNILTPQVPAVAAEHAGASCRKCSRSRVSGKPISVVG